MMAGRPLNSTLTICMGYFRPAAISKKDSVRAESSGRSWPGEGGS